MKSGQRYAPCLTEFGLMLSKAAQQFFQQLGMVQNQIL
jgi:hypothetical protein